MSRRGHPSSALRAIAAEAAGEARSSSCSTSRTRRSGAASCCSSFVPCDLAQLCRESLDGLPFDAGGGRRVAIEAEGPIVGRWGRLVRLEQVTSSTSSPNASVRYSPGDAPRCRSGVVSAATSATLSVADRGIGIPARPSSISLFTPFFRAQKARLAERGGLASASISPTRIVRRHGGTDPRHLDAEGAGTTFTVELPSRAGSSRRPDARAGGA